MSWHDPFIKTAVFFIKLGCYDFAELALSEYYANHGANFNHVYLLAVIDALKENYSDALIHLKNIWKDDVGNYQVNYYKTIPLLAVTLMKLGKFEAAEKLFNCNVAVDDPKLEHFLMLFMFGVYYNKSDDFTNALKLLTQAVQIFPCHLTFTELGKCYKRLRNLPSAAKCFQQAINFDNTCDAWKHLQEIYMKQNRMKLVDLCFKNSNCKV